MDAHFEQVTGTGQVAELSGPPVGSIQGSSVEASITSIENPVHPAVSYLQQPYVSMQAPTVGTSPSVRSQLPELSELDAFPRMPMPHTESSPAVGRTLPAPVMAMVHTTTTTTVVAFLFACATEAAEASIDN